MSLAWLYKMVSRRFWSGEVMLGLKLAVDVRSILGREIICLHGTERVKEVIPGTLPIDRLGIAQ